MTTQEERYEGENVDKAADFVFDRLAKALGLAQWVGRDGTETWDGDVVATLYGIPRDANVIDEDHERVVSDGEARRKALEGLIAWAMDTLHEINPSNYDHDDVCELNARSVEVILAMKSALANASITGGEK